MEIQNNLNKAIEIRLDYTKGGYKETIYAADLEDALMEMAKWKDEQFSIERKQLIEKAYAWLKEYARDYFHAEYCGEELTGEVSMNDNFIEDFKKAMEEQL